MSKRGNIPISIPDVIIPYSLGALSKHPEYVAAKAGSVESAIKLAVELITDELADHVSSLVDEGSILLPILAEEAQGRNKIPLAIAKVLQSKTGLSVDLDVYQANEVRRTALPGLARIFAMPEFEGGDLENKSFLLIDDTITQGGTFASLASHINSNGGRVVGALALTGKQYSARLNLSDDAIQRLKQKYGGLENDFIQATGYGFEALTSSEARYLASYSPSEAVRDYIVAARDERIRQQDGQASGNVEANQSDYRD